MSNEMTAIVEKMREFRLDAGITLQEIEQSTGISVQRLKRIEQGASPITVEEMDELLSFYQLDVNALLSYGNLQTRKYSRLTIGVIWAAVLGVAGYGGYAGYQALTAGEEAAAVPTIVSTVPKEEKVSDLLASSQKSAAKPTAEQPKVAAANKQQQAGFFRLAISGDTAYRSTSVRAAEGADFQVVPVNGFTSGGEIPAWLKQMAKNGSAGIDVANSDVLAGKSKEQIAAEVKRLRSQNIPVLGFGTQEEAFTPYIREKNGTKYGMLAVSRIVPSVDWKAEAGQAGVADAYGNHIFEDIRQAKKQADIVVVTIFWGPSDSTKPENYQKELAHRLIDAGADVIVGHRGTAIQPYEIYNGKYMFYNIGPQQLEMAFDGKKLKEVVLVHGSNRKALSIPK